MSNKIKTMAGVGDIQAYGKMLDGWADFVCPLTGTVNLQDAAKVINPIYDSLVQAGHPKQNLKVLAAAALFDVPLMRTEVSIILPEDIYDQG
ncbi:MAG: hypothetical protein AAB436_01780 [Patescibacteria group bacterium]